VTSVAAHGQTPAPATRSATTTRDITFTSHDGHAMLGRLTLPETPGPHPVLVMIQTAEAQAMEPQTRNAQGERVPVYSLYRDNLTPLGIGFFTYEGRGVFTSATGARQLDRAVYDTSTLANKVRDGIAAVRVLQKEAGVDASQIFLRGISEGTLLAVEIAASIPNEVKGLVLSGVIGDTFKSSLKFMASRGAYMQHLSHWDADGDGRISAQEFDTDPKRIRRQMPATVVFRSFDTDGDGSYTMAEYLAKSTPLVDLIEAENFDAIERWLQASAAMPLPNPTRAWLKDHFSWPSMWALVTRLTMRIGFFQGELDVNTSAADVRVLEQQAKTAGQTNLEFSYYAGLDHGLGTSEYFMRGTPSAGYAAMFAFMQRHTVRR
jgi:pimeloyl-ACP methyl ester carboxylesterase